MTSKLDRSQIPTAMPPEAPPELQAKREGIVSRLEAATKTTTGTVPQVLRVMAQVINNCRPGAELDGLLDQALREAFQRYEPEMATNPWPPVLVEAVQWMQDYLDARGFGSGEEAAVGAPAAGAPAAVQGSKSRDLFEKVSASRPSLTGEVPVAPAGSNEKAPDGSLKNWQLNPGLGKVRG